MFKEPKPEIAEVVELEMTDFKAGHWLGTKNPPLGLNEIFLSNHPKIDERARQMLGQMNDGEERELFRAVIKDDHEFCIVKIKKYGDRPSTPYLFAWPESQKFYEDGE